MNAVRILAAALCAAALSLPAAAPAWAADAWPSQPIRIIVPYSPGGVTDIVARLLAAPMSASLKTPVVVENLPGANGVIGAMAVVKAAPNGYTLLLGTPATLATNMLLYPDGQYDAARALEPIARIVSMPNALVVRTESPLTSVSALIERLRQAPGKLSFGVNGIGANGHLTTELFLARTQTSAVAVPYKGAAPMLTGLVSGDTDFAIDQATSVISLLKSGRIRALAVTSATRSPYLPEVPTMMEAGVPDFDMGSWLALAAPRGTPPDIVARLNRDLNLALKGATFRENLAQFAATPTGGTPEELRTLMRSETNTVRSILLHAKISVQ